MKVLIEVIEDQDKVIRFVECEASTEESIEDLANRIAGQLELEAEDLAADLGVNGLNFDRDSKVGDCVRHGQRWRHRRVFIDLHFESESQTHHFPPRSTWARVHRWGCRHFHVAADACVNLELREGIPERAGA